MTDPHPGHPGHPTHPLRVGAPLPPEMRGLPHVGLADIDAELDRAEVELLYAIAMHRKAWAAMRRRAVRRDELAETPGGLCAIEADPHWKKATGDVAWWRGEMEAQASIIRALESIREARTSAPRASTRQRSARSSVDTRDPRTMPPDAGTLRRPDGGN